MADNSTKIATLEGALHSGVLSITVDGVTTRFQNPDQIRASIADLKRSDTTNSFTTKRKLSRINLNSGGVL